MLGLSFKAGTDDLRESPSVQLIKRLLGEGCQVRVWDEHVSLGRLVGSNRQFIESVIPHIGTLLCDDIHDVITDADVLLLGTKAVHKEWVASFLRNDQLLIDLTRLEERQVHAMAATAS